MLTNLVPSAGDWRGLPSNYKQAERALYKVRLSRTRKVLTILSSDQIGPPSLNYLTTRESQERIPPS